MGPNRREFIRSARMISAGIAIVPISTAISKEDRLRSAQSQKLAPKKILILGGTGFIGPNTVKYAVERGHQVSIFTRGNKKSETPGVEHLVGDRNNDLSTLGGRKWDVVLDSNARDYRWVKLSTEKLKDSCYHYLFVSSVSAYKGETLGYEHKNEFISEPIIFEDSECNTPDENWKDGDDASYGLTKALSQNICHAAFPDRTTVVRPGLIVGPGDKTDRWTYWPLRIVEGGEVLAPGNPDHANQIIDQRDLTEWIVRLAENGTMGDFNGVGPANRMSMAQMLYGIWGGTGGASDFIWVNEDFLEEQGVQPWSELPSWVPGDPLSLCANTKSVDAGLTFRPLGVIAAETLEWELARPKEELPKRKVRLSREREKEILNAWKNK